uniref:Uncharacterized protein n=1 Tax=Solanum tuberosum TaxID=4113 RepID=M1DTG2_SOLTU
MQFHDLFLENVPSPEGENQVGERKDQSASHRTILRCSVRLPKVTKLEDAEDQGKKAMELTKGQVTELIGDPDLLRFRSIFLATINTFSNIMF